MNAKYRKSNFKAGFYKYSGADVSLIVLNTEELDQQVKAWVILPVQPV